MDSTEVPPYPQQLQVTVNNTTTVIPPPPQYTAAPVEHKKFVFTKKAIILIVAGILVLVVISVSAAVAVTNNKTTTTLSNLEEQIANVSSVTMSPTRDTSTSSPTLPPTRSPVNSFGMYASLYDSFVNDMSVSVPYVNFVDDVSMQASIAAKAFSSVSEFSTWKASQFQLTAGGSVSYGKLWSASASVGYVRQNSMAQSSQTESFYSVGSCNVEITLKKASISASDLINQNANFKAYLVKFRSLNMNESDYFDFFNTYGTFYISTIWLGGKLSMEFMTAIEKTATQQSMADTRKIQAAAAGTFAKKIKFSASFSDESSEAEKSLFASSSQSSSLDIIVRGGDPTKALDYVEWVKTVENRPSVMKYVLSPIVNVLGKLMENDPSHQDALTKMQTMMTRYYDVCGVDDNGNICSNHGFCNFATRSCSCTPPYFGKLCHLKECPKDPQGLTCGGTGNDCDYTTGTCNCGSDFAKHTSGYCHKIACKKDAYGNECGGSSSCNHATGACTCYGNYRLIDGLCVDCGRKSLSKFSLADGGTCVAYGSNCLDRCSHWTCDSQSVANSFCASNGYAKGVTNGFITRSSLAGSYYYETKKFSSGAIIGPWKCNPHDCNCGWFSCDTCYDWCYPDTYTYMECYVDARC